MTACAALCARDPQCLSFESGFNGLQGVCITSTANRASSGVTYRTNKFVVDLLASLDQTIVAARCFKSTTTSCKQAWCPVWQASSAPPTMGRAAPPAPLGRIRPYHRTHSAMRVPLAKPHPEQTTRRLPLVLLTCARSFQRALTALVCRVHLACKLELTDVHSGDCLCPAASNCTGPSCHVSSTGTNYFSLSCTTCNCTLRMIFVIFCANSSIFTCSLCSADACRCQHAPA